MQSYRGAVQLALQGAGQVCDAGLGGAVRRVVGGGEAVCSRLDKVGVMEVEGVVEVEGGKENLNGRW